MTNLTTRFGATVVTALMACLTINAVAEEIPAELPKPDHQPVDTTKPLKIYILSGQSNMVGMGHIAGDKPGTLETIVKKEKKFQNLVDAAGNWSVRNDVWYVQVTVGQRQNWLQPGTQNRTIGPELQFGHILGFHHDEMVMVIKASQGNRSLGFDVMPPSSRIGLAKEGKFYKGWQYDDFVADTHKVLDNLKQYFPDYQGQGYEIAGFGWWQGHKDGGLSQRYYERHLVNLINDLRAEFKAPKAPFVVATVGFDGKAMQGKYLEILKAQMAVGDSQKHPEFAGNVAAVDTRGFWRGPALSPTGAGYHYNGNAETYTLVGDAMGRAMADLLARKKHEQNNKGQ